MKEKIGAIDAWAGCIDRKETFQWPEEIRHIFRAYGTLEKLEGGYSAEEMIVEMDEWDVDVIITGSQKGLMLPPGLAAVALGEGAKAALARAASRKRSCYYLDLLRYLESYRKSTDVPFTPAISLIRGLEESLDMLLEEGMEAVWQRHARVASAVREGCQAGVDGVIMYENAAFMAADEHGSARLTHPWIMDMMRQKARDSAV